jgi:DNA-directed RNA polymerase specialized sigma24 family protein
MTDSGTESGSVLSKIDFERLLAFLNRNAENLSLPEETIWRMRGEKYEKVRRNLVRRFRAWNCLEPEELTDETFNRAAKKIPENYGADDDPEYFLLRIAYFVRLESYRIKPPQKPIPHFETTEEDELAYECLEQCMEKLTPRNRSMILDYYRGEKKSKIEFRKEISERFGIGMNALRIRVYRIRATLQKCVLKCVKFNHVA